MACVSKRSWKLQEFVAHNANVKCLALGRKSGRVMVTGSDDKKVNLWAIGKPSCFMSLSGHSTSVECVQFNHNEELVCAGSSGGALKVWDLEQLTLIRTLTGHHDSIKCIDFHPYGDYLASGSCDTSIKFWDSRKKGCIYTYQGHKLAVNNIKFSPDGNWIASCSKDCTVKIWDIRVGRFLKEFTDNESPINCLEFHPHEFLLAAGGADRCIKFYDLENFQLVSTEQDLGSVRCICFNPNGECLFAGVRDYLKVVGWEPNRLYDLVPVNWGAVCDISTASNQLVGASFHLTNVTVYVADLKKIQPIGGTPLEVSSGPFALNQSIRKSFSRAERPVCLKNKSTLDVKTIEESTSGTDPEEESAGADITNLTDYNEIFKGRKDLVRTPPPKLEPFKEPENDYLGPQVLGDNTSENIEALSLDNSVNYQTSLPTVLCTTYIRSKSNLDQVYASKVTKQESNDSRYKLQVGRLKLQRQSSCKDPSSEKVKPNDIKHSISDANISKNSSTSTKNLSRRNSFSKTTPRNNSVPNMSKIATAIPKSNDKSVPSKGIPVKINAPVDIYISPKIASAEDTSNSNDYIHTIRDKPAGLSFDDFLPKSQQLLGHQQHLPNITENEAFDVLMGGHQQMITMIGNRSKNLRLVLAQFKSNGLKASLETASAMSNLSITVDVLGIFNSKYNLWNLDACVIVLPQIEEMLESKYEKYIMTARDCLRLILTHFGSVITSSIQGPTGSFGVDLSREERHRKAVKCHACLTRIATSLEKKKSVPGNIGTIFKEINTLMNNTLSLK